MLTPNEFSLFPFHFVESISTMVQWILRFDSNFLISRSKLTLMYYFPFRGWLNRVNFTYLVWSPIYSASPLRSLPVPQIESIKPKILVWTERWKLASGVHCSHFCRISASRTSNWSLFLEPSKVSMWWVPVNPFESRNVNARKVKNHRSAISCWNHLKIVISRQIENTFLVQK